MMKKKDLLRTFDLASLAAIIIATIMVICYEFIGATNLLTLILIFYAAAALSLLVFHVLRLIYFVKDYKEDDVSLVDKNTEKKSMLILKIVLSSIIFVFTMIVLILH